MWSGYMAGAGDAGESWPCWIEWPRWAEVSDNGREVIAGISVDCCRPSRVAQKLKLRTQARSLPWQLQGAGALPVSNLERSRVSDRPCDTVKVQPQYFVPRDEVRLPETMTEIAAPLLNWHGNSQNVLANAIFAWNIRDILCFEHTLPGRDIVNVVAYNEVQARSNRNVNRGDGPDRGRLPRLHASSHGELGC